MIKQTEDYLSLKPIADRSREAASEITDEEIKSIIKDKIREKVDEQIDFSSFGTVIEEMIDNWFEDDDNCMFILDTLKDGVKRRLG